MSKRIVRDMAESRPRRGHGEDSMYFDRANNYWVAAVSLGYKAGKRVRRKVTGRTKTEVKPKLRDLRRDLDSGIRPSATYTVGAALDDWLANGLSGRSDRTKELYQHTVTGRPSKSLTLEQAQELLRAAGGSRLYAYVVLSVRTGLRTEELRALRWIEVDLDAGTVAVYRAVRATADTKTPRAVASCRCHDWLYGRSVSISAARPRTDRWLAFSGKTTALSSHRPLARPLIVITCSASSGRSPRRQVWVPREMRHTFVSLLSSNGTALEDIADLVGHTGTTTTETVYRKVIVPELRRGAEVMDRLFI